MCHWCDGLHIWKILWTVIVDQADVSYDPYGNLRASGGSCRRNLRAPLFECSSHRRNYVGSPRAVAGL
jgi:hypothetical protein